MGEARARRRAGHGRERPGLSPPGSRGRRGRVGNSLRGGPAPASAPPCLPQGHRGHHCSVLVTPGTRAGGQKSSAPVLIPQSTSKTLHVQQRRKRQAGSGATPVSTTHTPDHSRSVPLPHGNIVTAACECKVHASTTLPSSRSQPVETPAHEEDAREGTGKSRAHVLAAVTAGDRVRRGR